MNLLRILHQSKIIGACLLCQACAFENKSIDDTDRKIPKTALAQQLYFETPAVVDINPNDKNDAKKRGKVFMGQALPLGNGRLGAMFAGAVDSEYIVFNEISLWMNSTRGKNKVEQSGTSLNAHEHLETVRKAARDRKFGTGANSVESLGTQYLASKQRLGNYAPFGDLKIETGHDLKTAKNYRRALDISTGLGSVSYEIEGVKYHREYFCSFPDDLCVIRLASDGGLMDITLSAITAHDKKTIVAKDDELRLHGVSLPVVNHYQKSQEYVFVLETALDVNYVSTLGLCSTILIINWDYSPCHIISASFDRTIIPNLAYKLAL